MPNDENGSRSPRAARPHRFRTPRRTNPRSTMDALASPAAQPAAAVAATWAEEASPRHPDVAAAVLETAGALSRRIGG